VSVELQTLLTAKQTAELLAISPRTLWELTNCRKIPHLRFGKAVRYDPRDLHAWLDKKKRESLR
jgi:excisionase family DNA binding protein